MPASDFPEADFQAALRRAGLDKLLAGDEHFLRGVYARLSVPLELPPGFSVTLPPATQDSMHSQLEPEA